MAGVIITPLGLDSTIPAGASEVYVWISQISGAGLVLWTTVTVIWSLLACGRMARRNQFPSTYSIVSNWADEALIDPAMSVITRALTAEYVQLRNALDKARGNLRIADECRWELRRLALLARKYAAAAAAVEVARDSGDASMALVPTALADDLRSEFASQADRSTHVVDTLRAHTANAVCARKTLTVALPEPRSL